MWVDGEKVSFGAACFGAVPGNGATGYGRFRARDVAFEEDLAYG